MYTLEGDIRLPSSGGEVKSVVKSAVAVSPRHRSHITELLNEFITGITLPYFNLCIDIFV
jgi:hypothetical protein